MAEPAVIAFANYGWETSFATVSTSMNKQFGHGTKITTLARKNNMEAIYGLGNRNAQKIVPKKFEGAISVEFILANPWFFRSFLGTTTTTSSNPYVHTFTEKDTVESFSIFNQIESDTARVQQLLGCKSATIVITAAIGELVRVRQDIIYADESTTTTTSVVAETYDPFTFVHASLEMPNGSTIAEVQNVELTLAQNPAFVWGLGSRSAGKGPVKTRAYTGKISLAFEAGTNMLDKFMGGTNTGPQSSVAETATLELTFTNGLTSSNQRDIVLLFTGVQYDEHNMPQDPTELILEDAPIIMRSLQVETKDNVTAVQ